MIRGVLFDMDGVLIDTERLGMTVLERAITGLGYPYSEDVYFRVLGVNMETSRVVMREIYGSDFDYDRVHEIFCRDLMEIARQGKLPVKKGLRECMEGLRRRGIPCALATSSDRKTVEVYQSHTPALQGWFAAMVCGMEVPKGKPSPDIYQIAAGKLGLLPEECMGVEDSRFGLQSLRAAGCTSVMIPDLLPYGDELTAYTDYVLHDLTELCPLIDRLNGQSTESRDC